MNATNHEGGLSRLILSRLRLLMVLRYPYLYPHHWLEMSDSINRVEGLLTSLGCMMASEERDKDGEKGRYSVNDRQRLSHACMRISQRRYISPR